MYIQCTYGVHLINEPPVLQIINGDWAWKLRHIFRDCGKKISEFNWGFFNVEIVLHILVIRGAGKVLKFIYSEKVTAKSPSIICPLQSLTWSLQGENRVFPVKFSHTGKNLFSLHGTPAMNENRLFPVRKTSQGKPCFHYRDGFAVSYVVPVK